jgi:hypothetical protein
MMPRRHSVAAAALGVLMFFPGVLSAQSIDVSIPDISVNVPGAFDAPDATIGSDVSVSHNESDFDFVSRAVEEATGGISEALTTTAAGIAEGLEEMADALKVVGGDIASTMDELASVIVLCVDGGTCGPPDPPPPPPEP